MKSLAEMVGAVEDGGKVSSTRLGMYAGIAFAGYIAIAGLHLNKEMFDLLPVIALFLGAGVGGKLYHSGKKSKQE